MKELAMLVCLILIAMFVIIAIGSAGAMLAGTCDQYAPATTGDAYDNCTEQGVGLLYGLLGATPAPLR